MKNSIMKIMVVAIAIAASAFTTFKKPITSSEMNKKANQNWYFKAGHALGDAMSASNWSTTPEAECDANVEVPCQIRFEASNYQLPATNTPLQNYLNAEGSATQVRTDAISKRSE